MSQKIGLVFFVLILINSCQNNDSIIEKEINQLLEFNSNLMSELENYQNEKYEEFYFQSKDWKMKFEKIDSNYTEIFDFVNSAIYMKQRNSYFKLENTKVELLYRELISKNNHTILDSNISSSRIESIKNDLKIIEKIDSSRIYACLNSLIVLNSNYNLNLKLFKSNLAQSKYIYKSYIVSNSHLYRCSYDKFAAVAAIDRSVVLKNQIIEISAGIGSFDDKSKPTISIQNKFIELTDGIATLKIKAPNKTGTYRIPVVIDFITASGEQKRETRMIEYKVVDTICI